MRLVRIGLSLINRVVSQRFRDGFRERRAAVVAAVTLNSLPSVDSKPFHVFVLAFLAGHFGLALFAGPADNALEDSAQQLAPLAGFSPAPGCRRSGGFLLLFVARPLVYFGLLQKCSQNLSPLESRLVMPLRWHERQTPLASYLGVPHML
jgi:hypothetical protein